MKIKSELVDSWFNRDYGVGLKLPEILASESYFSDE